MREKVGSVPGVKSNFKYIILLIKSAGKSKSVDANKVIANINDLILYFIL